MELDFTGECFVPGKTDPRIEADHIERYRFACTHAAGKRVLDIACGAGYGTKLLVRSGAAHADGVDISPDHVAYANEHYGGPGVRFHQGDITTFRSENPYDLIVCFETIEHVADFRAALSNLFALLRPGGTLLVSSPNRPITSPKARTLRDKPGNKFHTQEFTSDELAAEVRLAGFHMDPRDVFGQRQQRLFPCKPLRKLYEKIYRPSERFSPVVERVESRVPRYIVLVATKPGAH